MRIPRWRLHAVALAVLSLAGVGVLLLPAPSADAGTSTSTNACINNVTGTYSDLGVTLSGTGAPDTVTVPNPVTVSGISIAIDVPGDLLIAGYNLGLLTTGLNSIPADVTATIVGTNTVEGTQAETVSVSGTTTITDPDGTPGTGDESATPLSVTAPLADQSWTPSGGDIDFKDGGSITSALIAGGLLTVTFNCTPGVSVDNDGDGDNETFTPVDPTPFDTVTVEGGTGTTTTTGATTTTTTGATTTTTEGSSTTTTTTEPEPEFVTGTATYATSCKNSLTPDLSELTFEITGTVPGEVNAGETFILSDQHWEVVVPGSVFQAGIGLGLIAPGDTVNASVDTTVFASNTVEGLQTATGIAVEFGPIEVGGDGLALDATAVFEPDDLTFTAVGGDSAIEMSGASVAVDLGLPVDVGFTCVPVTSGVAFVTATVIGESDLVAATTTTSGPDPTVAGTATPGGTGGGSTGGTSAGASTGGTGSATLPLTGPGSLLAIVIFGLVAIDLGYLLWSATKPSRRRWLNTST